MTAKKVLLWVWVVLSIFAIIGGATAYQLLPIVVLLAILLLELYSLKQLKVWGLVLSIIMLIVNSFVSFSLIDILMWTLTIGVFALSHY